MKSAYENHFTFTPSYMYTMAYQTVVPRDLKIGMHIYIYKLTLGVIWSVVVEGGGDLKLSKLPFYVSSHKVVIEIT